MQNQHFAMFAEKHCQAHQRDYRVKFVDLKFTEDVLCELRTTANGQQYNHSRENIVNLMSQTLCQCHISGLKEISLHQRNAEYAMKYVEVKGGFRDSDVFGVI